MPPLGLSNKAISDGELRILFFFNPCFKFSLGSQELIGGFDSSRKPFDGELASLTLWPEVEKIFGHGYEVRFLGPSVCAIRLISMAVHNAWGFKLSKAYSHGMQSDKC